ncbi:MAG: hypothetical protein EB127_03520 [Alphaproteobacteria bacterium]|nr:hypothetical protein [Alphaproteobacteria bacterium]
MGIEISNPGGGGITVETDPLALLRTGGIMSGAIRFDEVGIQNIAKGSFDSGRGGYNGISLNCAVEYELNWQAGYLKALNSGGFNVPINVESDIVLYSHEDNPQHTTLTANSISIIDDEVGTVASIGNSSSNSVVILQSRNSNQDPINQSQLSQNSLIISVNQNGQDEGISPFTKVLTINNQGVVQTTVNENGTTGFSLDYLGAGGTSNDGNDGWTCGTNSVSGYNDYGQNWSLGIDGLSVNNAEVDPADFQIRLNNLKVSGHTDSYNTTIDDETVTIPAKDWEFGVDGLKFIDGTIQTTAGITIDPYEGGINFEATNTYGGLRVRQTRNDGDGDYTAFGQLNTYGFNFVSEGNPNGDWIYGMFQDGVHFNDGTIQSTAYAPIAFNSGLSQSGNMAHSDYPKEIQLTINGVTYAIPARIV